MENKTGHAYIILLQTVADDFLRLDGLRNNLYRDVSVKRVLVLGIRDEDCTDHECSSDQCELCSIELKNVKQNCFIELKKLEENVQKTKNNKTKNDYNGYYIGTFICSFLILVFLVYVVFLKNLY